jgi:hypothetical protein
MVKSVDFVAFDPKKETQQIRVIKNRLQSMMHTLGLYFSYDSDLTSNLQRQFNLRKREGADFSSSQRYQFMDRRYLFNNYMLEPFVYQKVDPAWTVPLI